MKKKDFCIIGIGRFGKTIANKLVADGNSVMVIDNDRAKINNISGEVSFASTLDATNPESLKNIGINDLDHIIVAIGENVKDSIMTCAALKQLGLPNETTQVTVKASNVRHANVLKNLGFDDVVTPEYEVGKNTSLRIVGNNIKKAIYLTDKNVVFQLVLKNAEFQGIKLEKVAETLKINDILITSILRGDKSILPVGEAILEVGDIIWVASKISDMDKIESSFSKQL